jgi:hypothetical protein
MYLLEYLYKEIGNIAEFYYFSPIIFIYNSSDSNIKLKEIDLPTEENDFFQIMRISKNRSYKAYKKLKIRDIEINSNSGIFLVDSHITDDLDAKVKYSAKNIKILNSLDNFINNINQYLDQKIKSENYKFYFKSIQKLFNIINFDCGTNDKISVILATYNSENTICNAVNSILTQTYQNFELIVIDDSSTDNSIQLLNEYKNHPKIKIVNLHENRGVYFARNIGLNLATGKYITFQDADDISLPHRLQTQYYFYSTRKPTILFSRINNKQNRNVSLLGMVTIFFEKKLIDKNGMYDFTTRHSGDLEYVDRLYFRTFGRYKNIDMWLWLNTFISYKDFCYIIPDKLYEIGPYQETNITKQYNKRIRDEYLKKRQENKFLE